MENILEKKNRGVRAVLVVFIVLLLAALGVAGVGYWEKLRLSQSLEQKLADNFAKEKYAAFNQMFVREVIVSKDQVNFETRLTLENAVRDLKDGEVFEAWNKFAESETSSAAQEAIKKLLGLLADRLASK